MAKTFERVNRSTTFDYSAVDNLQLMELAANYNDYLKRLILENRDQAKTALDFGAGIGTFSNILSKVGLEVTCIDLDLSLVEQLRQQGFKAYATIKETHDTFDYIYSLNVLEHVEDDEALLKEFYQFLNPEGRLLLYIPAFPVLFSSMDRKVGHFRRYRRKTLLKTLFKVGFQIERVRYIDSIGFIMTLLYMLVGNNRGDLNPTIIKLYDHFLFPISCLMDRCVGCFFGKNLVVVARKISGRDNPCVISIPEKCIDTSG